MTSAYFTADNYTGNCAYQCGGSSCANNVLTAYAALFAVCAFILALMAIIINSGAIISVIINIAIIGIIIIRCQSSRARELYLL